MKYVELFDFYTRQLPSPICDKDHLYNDVQVKLLRSIFEEEIGLLRVMKQSSDFICGPFSKSLEKVEGANGRCIFYAEREEEEKRRRRRRRGGAARSVEVEQP